MNRTRLIGRVREMAEELLDGNYLAAYREIFGDVDRFNFAGVPTIAIEAIHAKAERFLALHEDPRGWGRAERKD